jgi:hypothetical protein
MSLTFRTLRSGSSGNSQLLISEGYALLVDLGLPANTALRECLAELRQRGVKLLGAVITHEHGDHFAPGPLRAMSGLELPVWAPRHAITHCAEQLKLGFWSGRPRLVCYDEGESWERSFRAGPFEVRPVEVTHHPGGTCYAFDVRVMGRGGREIRAVVATDLCHPRGLPGRLVDADLIYLECNHDPELLRMRPNPASKFHLENSKCGRLLVGARRESARPPVQVVLGHLSDRRNTPSLAMEAVRDAFLAEGVEMDFPLSCAPRHHPSVWMEVGAGSGAS